MLLDIVFETPEHFLVDYLLKNTIDLKKCQNIPLKYFLIDQLENATLISIAGTPGTKFKGW